MKGKEIEERISIIKRIKSLFKDLNNREIARLLNTSPMSVGRWFNDNAIPPYHVLIEIAEKCEVTLDWLLTGKEPLSITEALKVKEERVPYARKPDVGIHPPNEVKSRIKKAPYSDASISIPLLSDAVFVRDPININEEDIQGFEVISQHWLIKGHIYRCVQVKGNSMSPILEDGFIIAIDCSVNQPKKLQGKMVAARHLEAVSISWLQLSDTHYILMPQNTNDYKPVIIPRTEKNVIIGEVACWWGKPKPRK